MAGRALGIRLFDSTHPILSPGWDCSSRECGTWECQLSLCLGGAGWQGGDARRVCAQTHVGWEPRAVLSLARPGAEICLPSRVTWGCTLSPLCSPVGLLHEELSSGPRAEWRLINGGYHDYFIISDGLEGGSPEFNPADCQALPPCTFYAARALEFPINLIGLDIKEPVVHGIPESINNLPFTAPIRSNRYVLIEHPGRVGP